MEKITAEELRKEFKYRGGNTGGLRHWDCDYKGARINHKRLLTWARLAKEFKEIQATEETGKELDEKYLYDFYRALYPSIRAIIKKRNATEITRTFKEEYGAAYENGTGYSCYPDKIVFRISGSQVQIVWGKFTTKLLAYLDAHPEVEEGFDHFNETVKTEFSGNPDEPLEGTLEAGEDCGEQSEEEELLCDDCANASALTGNIDLCANCGPSGRNYEQRQNGQNSAEKDETGENTDEAENGVEKGNKGFEDDPESYNAWDVSILLLDYQHDLEAFKDTECPSNMIQKQKILVDALTLLASSMEG